MPRAVVLHVSNPKTTDKYPSLVNPGYIYSAKGEPLTVEKIQQSNVSLVLKVDAIDKFIKTLPTREHLSIQAKAMHEELAKIPVVSTGLTVYIEEYTMSGSTMHAPR
jgi:hypothetical protein